MPSNILSLQIATLAILISFLNNFLNASFKMHLFILDCFLEVLDDYHNLDILVCYCSLTMHSSAIKHDFYLKLSSLLHCSCCTEKLVIQCTQFATILDSNA